jgi:hypothetical protein
MNEYEDRIRRALALRASDVSVEPEPEELADRVARRERRRVRALSVGLVLALFAGPTLGFVVGRGNGGATDRVAARDRSGDGVVVESHGALPKLSAGSSGFSQSTGGSSAPPSASGVPVASSLVFGVGVGNVQLARAFVRDIDGVKIRVYRAALDLPADAGLPWWNPPGWCFPNGVVQTDVSTDEAVGIASSAVYAALRESVVGGSLSVIGLSEGSPLWVIVAQAPAGSTRVRATFPGGATDEMAPVDGVAVLIARSSPKPSIADLMEASATVEAFGAGGASLGSSTARFGGFGGPAAEALASDGASSGALGTDCMPPQQLPPPGPEQPADPAAARQAVTNAFNVAHDNKQPDDVRMAAIDQPAGFPEIWKQLREGPYKEQIRVAVITIDDLVYVQYHWDVPGYGTGLSGRFGEVVYDNGAWKMTRASMCADISLAGVKCT